MVSRSPRVKTGFTLLEVLVAVALFMLVMLLLVKGVTAVTTTVTLGQRQSELHRILKSVRRVMQEDLAAMIVHPDWPVYVGDGSGEAFQLAFLRYRFGSEGDTETEWVQYWREAHDSERLEKWVRYSAPFINRSDHRGEWWNSVDRAALTGEVLVDDLIALDLVVQSADQIETGTVTNQVDVVDVHLFITVAPLPPEIDFAKHDWQRMWMHFRTRPGFEMGPVVEEVVEGTP